ncbi:Hypothetical predicted protein [Paramuricea clavata]|uniref:Uncharacterized protein n=1 Tax=Paramuricea clavata TaxID=317549 RepID=A0A6S7JFU8_PARCT|nr:Hypothetical predicted protein [Paramuricea clavata]
MTCILPTFSESIIPATLKCDADLSPDGLVGNIESNPTLAERYHVCGAATLVTVKEKSTVPFRIINDTSQPVTIYRCTNLGQFPSYEEPLVVTVIDTRTIPEDKPQRTSLLLESIDHSNSDLDDKQQAQLRQLLLRSTVVKLKSSRCSFAPSRVEYLAHVVSRDGIRPDPSKIAAVKDVPVPECVRDVRRFLAPILAYPDFIVPFELKSTNASSNGIGIALCQTQDGQSRAIVYGGRDLTTAERKYSTTEREALGISEGMKKFRN